MTSTLTRRRFLVLSCMGGTALAVVATSQQLRYDTRKPKLAVVLNSFGQTDDLLSLAESPMGDVVAIAGLNHGTLGELATRSKFANAQVVALPCDINRVCTFDGLIWLRSTGLDPSLLQAVAAGKHVLLSSRAFALVKANRPSLQPGQILRVLPMRAPVGDGTSLAIDEPIRQITVARNPIEPRPDFPTLNEFLHENIHDELTLIKALFDGSHLDLADVAVAHTPRALMWSARYQVVGADGRRSVVHVSVDTGKSGFEDVMLLHTDRKSIHLPILQRTSQVLRVYADEFASAIRCGSHTSLLGAWDDALTTSSLISKSTACTTAMS